MYITASFAAILTFFFIRLSFKVIELRKLHRTPLGGEDIEPLKRAIRAHGNFVEYVPLSLILMGVLELNGAPTIWISLLGTFLLLGRHFHAKGMISDGVNFQNRVIGMKFTLVGLALLALSNVMWLAYVFVASVKFAAIH